MRVTIHRILTGRLAAEAGGVRINLDDEAHILLARNLTLDEEAGLLGELLEPDDTLDFHVVIPAQRGATEAQQVVG